MPQLPAMTEGLVCEADVEASTRTAASRKSEETPTRSLADVSPSNETTPARDDSASCIRFPQLESDEDVSGIAETSLPVGNTAQNNTEGESTSSAVRPVRTSTALVPDPRVQCSGGENMAIQMSEILPDGPEISSDERLAQIPEKPKSQGGSGGGECLFGPQISSSKSLWDRGQNLPDTKALSLSTRHMMQTALGKLSLRRGAPAEKKTVECNLSFGEHPAAGLRTDSANINDISAGLRFVPKEESVDNFARLECREMKDKKQLLKKSKIANAIRCFIPCANVQSLALADVRVNRAMSAAPSTAAPSVSISRRNTSLFPSSTPWDPALARSKRSTVM